MKAIPMTLRRPVRAAGPNTILGVVLTAYLMILLDLSIVYTGMPEIGKTMTMSPVTQTWVQNAYLLCFGGFLLLSARLGDTFGRRRILLGYSALQAGLGFLPVTLLTFVSAMAIPRVTRAVGSIPMLMGALLFIVVGLVWMARAGADAAYWQLALPMVLIGIGNGAAMAPLTTSGVRGVESRDQGAASGLVNVAHQLGGSISLSMLIVVFAAGANPQLTGAAEMSHQISAVLVGAAAMNVLALVLTALFILPANPANTTISVSAALQAKGLE
jgi:MFS family permease